MGSKRARPLTALLAWLSAFVLLALVRPACAAAVEVMSPGGLRIWLVEDHSEPVLTLGFRFKGGSSLDPADKEGVAHLTAEAFFEGAGSMDANVYLQRWSDIGAEINIEARLESLRGTVRVPTTDRDEAVRLLALAFAEPRFEQGTLDQVRDQITAEIDRATDDPESFAFLDYDVVGFGGHARARPVGGTRAGIAAITAQDIDRYRNAVLTREGLSLSAVGDITPHDAGLLADRIFASLPPQGEPGPLPVPAATVARREDLSLPLEQAEVVFGVGLPGLSEREKLAAELINYTVGGSAFTSRLYHQVREKRGLAYAIGTNLDSYSFMSELSGSFASAPDTVEQAIALVRKEFADLQSNPPADDEIAEAKVALAGQYLRGLIRQADLANELTLRMGEGASSDCIDTYPGRLAAISPDEVRDLAKRIPWLARLVIVTVGAPAPGTGSDAARSRLHTPQGKEP